MDTGKSRKILNYLAGVLGLLGIILIVDALLSPGILGYRLAAWLLGGSLTVPLVLVVIFRDKGRRVLMLCSFALVPAFGLFLAGEIILRLVGMDGQQIELLPDDRLGHRLSPASHGADAWGFRNSSVTAQADVVFLGDSQVYGYGVDVLESIPLQFAAASGLSTYSMGLGGYGPIQYRELCERALDLEPELVVVGLYLGNDIIDAHLYGHLVSAQSLRNPAYEYPLHQAVELRGKASPNLAMALLDSMRELSVVIEASIQLVKKLLFANEALARIYAFEPGAPGHKGGDIDTLFTPNYRLGALNFGDERVLDGLRITSLCLQDIARSCADAGVPCLLVLIPTKESCYQQYYESRGAANPLLTSLSEAEAACRDRLIAIGNEAGLVVVDPSRKLVAALEDGRRMWPIGSDGHPLGAGYSVIAASIQEAWRAMPAKEPR